MVRRAVTGRSRRTAERTATLRFIYIGLALTACIGTAGAQSAALGGAPPPTGMDLAASTARRFPQPVRVGDLLNRSVLQPMESQDVLGRVSQVIRDGDGTVKVVIDFGGLLGLWSRPIAVPTDAMVLLGQDLEVVAFTPQQLREFPTFAATGTTPMSDDTVINMGLAKPPH